jgi:putative acetyltransferase
LPDRLELVESDPESVDLATRYPGRSTESMPRIFEKRAAFFCSGAFPKKAVAFRALRPMDDSVVEVKRMYVRESHRGRGFGRAMLGALEEIAAQRGYRTIRLETGGNQPEAIALYKSAGYHAIPCYGAHASDPVSRCFEKSVTEPRP